MYEELKEQLKPLPKFNLKWNITTDQYSDGDIEDVIVKMLANNGKTEYAEAIANQFSWATFYHLTDFRANILNWYPFKKGASVLEIGCGFGAITQSLCENCESVTAVELSERRATGTLFRCRDCDNLEIIVGNLNDIKFDKKFDYITLIGVLEYQGKYTKTDNPYVDFLKTVRQFLKPDGKLLIAIENQFGIKYWCGTAEDHTGIPFDGMNNYAFSNNGVRTFSKSKLDSIIKESGFENTYFYYPMPDYKLPVIVYSEKYIPKHIDELEIMKYTSVGKKSAIACEGKLYQELVDNGVFDFFANSFLVECSDINELGEVIFAKCNNVRAYEYKIGTRIYADKRVEKFSLSCDCAKAALKNIVDMGRELSEHGLNIVAYSDSESGICCDFANGKNLNGEITKCIHEKNADKIYMYMDMIWEDINRSSEALNPSDNIMYTFDGYFSEMDYGTILRKGYLDLISRNALVEEDKLIWIDQEWLLENVPAKFVMYRNLEYLYKDCPSLESVISRKSMLEKYGLLQLIDEFIKLDNVFYQSVLDEMTLSEFNSFSVATPMDCVNNINKLLK